MPWITEGEKTYWMPDQLPERTPEYTRTQSLKRYLTPYGEDRPHPGWTYSENNALVDDEYLFQNEDWKLIIDDNVEVSEKDFKHSRINPPEMWEEIDEKKVRITYSLLDFTQEEIDDFYESKWGALRYKRDSLLLETDWIITRSLEKNLSVPEEIVNYRQQLRDFPATVSNILDFDINDNSLWPTKPNF